MIKNNMQKKKKNVIKSVRIMTSSVSIIADDPAEGLNLNHGLQVLSWICKYQR